MLTYEEMPEDNKDLAKVEVAFPRLREDSAESCPVPMLDVVEYLALEGEDVSKAELVFLRTAQVAESRFWIWRFADAEGRECYATVETRGRSSIISYDTNWYGLSPEQFMLGEYHGVF